MIILIFIFFASSLLCVLYVQNKYYSNSDQEVLNVSLGWPNQQSTSATQAIACIGQRLQAISTDTPNFIMDDFNNCKPGKSLGNFCQYVTCATWLTKCLDRCYSSIKGAYKSLQRAPLGESDHNVYLVPSYKPVLKRHKLEWRFVPVWSEESIQRFQDCYACTDWDFFTNASESVDELTKTVSDYAGFCEDSIIHKRSISIFPNIRSWVYKSVKNTLNQRSICFNKGGSMVFYRMSSLPPPVDLRDVFSHHSYSFYTRTHVRAHTRGDIL